MKYTRKARVLAAIHRQPLDYFPSQVDFTAAAAKVVKKALDLADLNDLLDNHIVDCYSLGSVEEYLQDPPILQSAINAGLAILDQDAAIAYDGWGVGWDLIPEGGWPRVHPLEDIRTYKNYKFPDPCRPQLMDLVRETVEKESGKYFILASHHTALFERAWALRGFQNVLMDFYLNRSFLDDLYDRITEYQIGLARQFIAAGVDGVRVGDDYGTQRGLIMKPDLWREVIKPRLKRIYEVYQKAGIPVIHHTCGDVRSILDDFAQLGLDVLHPIQPLPMPISSIPEKYYDLFSFFGGIDTQQLLPFSSPEEIRISVRATIEKLGSHGGYIISPAQAIMADVPLPNILALLSAIKEYRSVGCLNASKHNEVS